VTGSGEWIAVRRRWHWLPVLLLLLPACAQALDADAALRQLMQEQYGAYSARDQGWAFRAEGLGYVMKVVQSKKVATPYGERLYVFAAGNLADAKYAGHGAPGLAGAFVLEEKAGQLNLVAASKAIKAGSFGAAPDKVKLLQFGPDHYYGWVYESGYTGQGYTGSHNDVLLPRGKSVAVLASIASHMDNEGVKPCDEPATRGECESLDFDLKIDSARGDVKVYPLVVTRSGVQAGSEVKPTTWRIDFDEKKWRYEVPAALQVQY
jgi:hypothetical protein